ncbi:hypothetical protein SprV_0301209600 [Sparganum proliferum]
MKSIADSFAYWPGVDGDIDDLVRRCSPSHQVAKMPPPQPPIPWQPPESPWSRAHIDFAGPLNIISYLILVDAYSKWPEIAPLNPATASATIAFLRRIFSKHGLPEVLVSFNGSQFTSSTFEDFCRHHNIQRLVPTGVKPAQTSSVSRSKLSVGTPVFVRDYRTEFPDWIEATIVAHRGSVLFDVDVSDDIWVRHHNPI